MKLFTYSIADTSSDNGSVRITLTAANQKMATRMVDEHLTQSNRTRLLTAHRCINSTSLSMGKYEILDSEVTNGRSDDDHSAREGN